MGGSPRRGPKHGGGFVSKAQWRKFFADPALRRYAHRVAHRTPGGPKLRYRALPDRARPRRSVR